MTISLKGSITAAGLSVLIIIQIIMIGAMFSQTQPHPPLFIPLFGLVPFLAASIAAAVAALVLGAKETRVGLIVTWAAAGMALLSFGPQKWFDPAIAQIWPAVLISQIAICAILLSKA